MAVKNIKGILANDSQVRYLCKTARYSTDPKECKANQCIITEYSIMDKPHFLIPVGSDLSTPVCVSNALNRQLKNALDFSK